MSAAVMNRRSVSLKLSHDFVQWWNTVLVGYAACMNVRLEEVQATCKGTLTGASLPSPKEALSVRVISVTLLPSHHLNVKMKSTTDHDAEYTMRVRALDGDSHLSPKTESCSRAENTKRNNIFRDLHLIFPTFTLRVQLLK